MYRNTGMCLKYLTGASAGDCVSVNVLVYSNPGPIAHISGFLTFQFYQYACMFVDHYSDFIYVHLLKSQTVDESVEAKKAFKAYVESQSVDIKHYHADNGIFRSA